MVGCGLVVYLRIGGRWVERLPIENADAPLYLCAVPIALDWPMLVDVVSDNRFTDIAVHIIYGGTY